MVSAMALPDVYRDYEFRTQTNFTPHVIFRNNDHEKELQAQRGGHSSKNQISVNGPFQMDCYERLRSDCI